MTSFSYSIAGDFPAGVGDVSPGSLFININASPDIVIKAAYVSRTVDVIQVAFAEAIDAPQIAALNAIIAAYIDPSSGDTYAVYSNVPEQNTNARSYVSAGQLIFTARPGTYSIKYSYGVSQTHSTSTTSVRITVNGSEVVDTEHIFTANNQWIMASGFLDRSCSGAVVVNIEYKSSSTKAAGIKNIAMDITRVGN